MIRQAKYEGWGASMNFLSRKVFDAIATRCDWVVAASDDIYPIRTLEPKRSRFSWATLRRSAPAIPDGVCGGIDADAAASPSARMPWSTFGVMQPIGDLKAWPASRIDRICGSPWLGREFCRRMYQGNGPFWPEYRHMFDDEELFEVSKRMGVLWQREDLTHRHEHWGRKTLATRADIPPHFIQANSPEQWRTRETCKP